MDSDGADAADLTLTAEESSLRTELRALQDERMGALRLEAPHEPGTIDTLEKRVRAIVLRLTEIERERIENHIARSL